MRAGKKPCEWLGKDPSQERQPSLAPLKKKEGGVATEQRVMAREVDVENIVRDVARARNAVSTFGSNSFFHKAS